MSDLAIKDINGTLAADHPPVKASLESGSKYNTSQLAESHRIANGLGWPEQLVRDALPESALELQSKVISQNEKFAGWASKSPANAALAREDQEALGAAITQIGSWQEMADNIKKRVTDRPEERDFWDKAAGVPKSLGKTVLRFPGVFSESVYNTAAMGAGVLDYMEADSAKLLGALGLTNGERTGMYGRARDRLLVNANVIRESYLESDFLSLPENFDGRLIEHPEWLLDPEYLTYQLGDAASSLATMFLGAGAVGGSAKAAASIGGIMEAGSFYDDLLADGVSNETALTGALSFGVVTGLLNKLGLDKILEGAGGKTVLQGLRNALVAGSVEAATEYAENPAQAVIEGVVKQENPEQILARFFDSLKDVDVIPGSFLLGGGVRAAQSRRNRAGEYAEAGKELHKSIDATKLKNVSPEMMQEILEQEGITQNALIPADKVLELYQSEPVFMDALGLTELQLTEAAATGQDVEIPVARLMARLDTSQYEKIADIMKETPESFSTFEAIDENRAAEETEKLLQTWKAQQREQDEFNNAVGQLKEKFATAFQDTPGLAGQTKSAASISQLIGKFAVRHYTDPTRRVDFLNRISVNNPIIDELVSARQQTLFQPINSNVDLDKNMPVVPAQIEQTSVWASMKGQGRKSIIDAVAGDIYNEAIGERIELTRKNAAHLISSTTGRGLGGDAHIAAVRNIKELVRVAEPIESYTDRKNQEDVRLMHRFFAPMQYDGAIYAVNMTVKEYGGERLLELDEVKKLYDLKLENKTPVLLADTPVQQGNLRLRPTGVSDITIRQLLDGVNDSEGNSYLQPSRGSVRFAPDGGYEVHLYEHSNVSTLIHESAHIFDEELNRLIKSGMADDAMIADKRILDKWLARFDSDAELKVEYNKRLKGLEGFKKNFNKLTEEEKNRAREVAKREYFARSFELYIREGKAPSEELRSAFARFKRWLLQIYKEAKILGVELTDDVRGVFDRMLSTDAEITEAIAVNELFALTEKELDALGTTGAERSYQTALIEAAKNKAVEELHKEREADRKERHKAWREEAKSALLKDPVYAARQEFYTAGGYLDVDLLLSEYGEEMVKALRKSAGPGVVRENGQPPAVWAAKHGFADAAEALGRVTNAESLTKRIEQIVQAKEAEYDASIDASPFVLDTEEAAKQIELVGQYLARNLGREAVTQRAFRLFAREQLKSMPMHKARLDGQFNAAMRRALRKERQAIGSGDFAVALEANTQARLNMEMARQAREIGRMQQRTEKAAKRFVAMKKGEPAARFFVNDIAARSSLMPYDLKLAGGKDYNTIANWLQDKQSDGYAVFLDESVLKNQTSWKDQSVEQFENVADAISQIIGIERNSRKLLTAKDKADFETSIDEAVSTILTYHKAKPAKTVQEDNFVARGLNEIHAWHTKIEALCVALDGGKALGRNWELIYKPINDAENTRGTMFKEVSTKLKGNGLFGAYTQSELAKMARKKEFEPAIGESITKGQRLMVALNMGNEGNYRRLLDGRGWTEEQVIKVVDALDERDWKFVQGVWDLFENYKQEAFNLQEEVTGQRPASVEAKPFMTKHGEVRGGYFPVVYDSRHAKVDLQEKLITDSNPVFAMTKHGHLKERNAQGAKTPLDLNLSVIPSRLNDLVTDLSFRRAYIDVGRVLRNTKYRSAIESTVGHEQYQAVVSWLKDSAKIQNQRSIGENMSRWARSTSTAMAMGYKVTTALAQPFGITQSIDILGYTNIMKGLNMAYGKGPFGTAKISAWVKSASPFMEQRLKSFDRDVADATAEFSRQSLTPDNLVSALTSKIGLRKFENWLKENAFVPMGVIQYGVDLPTWLGAYQKGLKDFNGSETKARDYADSVVRLSQGSGQNKDLSRIQRGNQYLKLFTMFYSYFNSLYNLTALRVADVNMNRDAGSVIRAANSFLLLYVIPSILTEIVAGRGPDDDEEFLAWSAKQLAMYPMQTVVGLRTMAGVVEAEFGYKSTPAEDAPESIYRFIVVLNKALTDEDYEVDGKKMSRLSVRTLGFLSGLPLGQAEITTFNIIDYMDGTTEDFELRDLFFRKQKSRR